MTFSSKEPLSKYPISSKNSVLLFAHRGAPTEAPENTLASFAAALDVDSDVLEADVHLSADGHPVLSHDPDFSRLAGDTRPLAELSRDEIAQIDLGGGEKPLFLDDALKAFPETVFNIDIKVFDLRLIKAFIRVIREADAIERVVAASFDDRTLKAFRKLCPEGKVSTGRLRIIFLAILAALGFPPPNRKGEVSIQLPETFASFRLLTPKRIKKWQQGGLAVNVWTIDDEEDMRRLISWGVSGIMSNQPRKLRRILDELSLRVDA